MEFKLNIFILTYADRIELGWSKRSNIQVISDKQTNTILPNLPMINKTNFTFYISCLYTLERALG